MESMFNRIFDWYKSRPWWGKVLFFGVLVLLALLYIAKMFWPILKGGVLTPIKKISVSPPFGKINEALDTRIEDLKKELLLKLETVRQTGIRAGERREAIKSASTMAELDALKKKYGL